MTTKPIYDGGPAFPRPASEWTASGTIAEGNSAIPDQDGMSLRDYFAGQALCGIIAAPGMQPDDSNRGGCATLAYEFADAMLTARKGGTDPAAAARGG